MIVQLERANTLLSLEKELNHIKYLDIPIGGLLAFAFEQINKNGNPTLWYIFPGVIKNILHNFILGYTHNNSLRDKVVITKHGSTNHLNRMMDPLIEHWQQSSILFQSKEIPSESLTVGEIYFQNSVRLSRMHQLKVLFSWLKIRKIFKRVVQKHLGSSFNNSLHLLLLLQLCKIQFWQDYFIQGIPNKVITDYDRGHHTAP